jgi:hypothetical protein
MDKVRGYNGGCDFGHGSLHPKSLTHHLGRLNLAHPVLGGASWGKVDAL